MNPEDQIKPEVELTRHLTPSPPLLKATLYTHLVYTNNTRF